MQKHFLTKYLILLTLLISSIECFSKNILEDMDIEVKVYNQEDGLSYKRVLDVAQDKKGFIWIATHYGLNKFDGHRFTKFYAEEGNPNSPLSNDINSIVFDEKEILYMSQYNSGLSSYDPKKNKFTHLITKENLRGIPEEALSTTNIEYTKNVVWVTGPKGVYTFNTSSKKARFYSHGKNKTGSLHKLKVIDITKDNKGLIWLILSRGFIAKYDKEKNEFTVQKSNNYDKINLAEATPPFSFHNSREKITLNKDGINYILNVPPFHNFNTRELVYWHNILWMCTNSGLRILKQDNKTYEYIDLRDYFKIESKFIFHHFLVDNEKNLWIATDFGLIKLTKRENPFTFLFKKSIANIHYNYTSGISKIDTNIFFSINNRLYNKEKNIYTDDFKSIGRVVKNQFKVGSDKSKTVWFCSNEKVFEYSLLTNNTIQLDSIPKSIHNITYDENRKILWGFSDDNATLLGFDPSQNYKKIFKLKKEGNALVDDLLFDNNGEIWLFQSLRGTIIYNPEDNTIRKKFEEIPFTDGAKYILTSRNISQSRIALGTRDGLIIYNKKNNTYKVYKKKDGLVSSLIGEIIQDKNGDLWLFSDWGLSRFDIENEKVYNLYKTQNFFSSSINMKAIYNERNDRIYFSSLRGVGYIDLETLIQKNKENNHFQFTSVSLDGKKISSDNKTIISSELPYAREISVSGKYKRIDIHFSKNTYSTDKTIYRYKLYGFDKEWVNAAHTPKASYSFLPSGDYYFHVQYTKNNGKWSKEDHFIKLSIQPPFWRSKIAMLIYFAIALTIIVYVIIIINQSRISRKTKRKKYLDREHKNKIFRLKERLYKDTFIKGSEIFELVRSNSSQTKIAKKIIEVENNISKILSEKLTTDEELFNISKRKVNYLEIAQRAFDEFTELASINKLSYKLTNHQIPKLSIADEELVYEIYSGLLSIVFKYMDEGDKIDVSIGSIGTKEETTIINFTITDNSTGFPLYVREQLYFKTASNTVDDQFSIQIIREMIRAHYGKLELSTSETGGNKISILLPNNMPEKLDNNSFF